MSQKPSSKRLNNMIIKDTVRIGSRILELMGTKKLPAGSGAGDLWGKHGKGILRISVVNFTDPMELFDTTFHEILEVILLYDKVRYCDRNGKPMFVFDHDYFNTISSKLIDALVSCGMLILPDSIEFAKIQGTGKG